MSAIYRELSRMTGYFPLPNEIFELGLCAGELAVYSYLMRCENRKTYQCWPSLKTIGRAVCMSENTVRKYVYQLGERDLIEIEPTTVITRAGEKRNGSLRFTICPFRDALAAHRQQQLDQMEIQMTRQRAENALNKRKAHRRRL